MADVFLTTVIFKLINRKAVLTIKYQVFVTCKLNNDIRRSRLLQTIISDVSKYFLTKKKKKKERKRKEKSEVWEFRILRSIINLVVESKVFIS